MNQSSEIERAATLLRSGKPLESAALCGAILGKEPHHAAAAHLLGLSLKDAGDWAQGERWLRFSIKLAPEHAEFHANLANLLRLQGKYFRAERFYRRALELLPAFTAARRGLAVTLNDLARFEEAEAECRRLTQEDPADAGAWVVLGLTLANLNRLAEAEAAYRRAIEFDSGNAVAYHNLGEVLARRAEPEAALHALETARSLGADGYELAFNRGRAALEANDFEVAEAEFERAIAAQPANTEAQLNLARIRFMRGDPQFARTLTGAVAANREDVALQLALAEVLWRAGDPGAAATLVRDVLTRKGPHPRVQATLAAILLESGSLEEAESQALDATTALPDDPTAVQTLTSVLLARGCPEDAMRFISAQLGKSPNSQTWLAFEAVAARALGLDRYRALYDYEGLVQVFELPAPAGWSSLSEFHRVLSLALNDRHRLQNHPLDQSLRNGTQTTRSLVTDPDPTIQALLGSFVAAIEEYRGRIRPEPGHPLASVRGGKIELAGAWSVRLRRDGFHVNHVHPDGVISSAYYVDVPAETRDPIAKSGWLKLGEPRYPVPGITPERFIQPRPGRLVLFPSYMWHGTNAIHGEEARACVAFDVRMVNR
jgi:Flp pilus assembly protein TadD